MLVMAVHDKKLKLDSEMFLDSSLERVLSADIESAVDYMRGTQAFLVTIISALIGSTVLYHLVGSTCLIPVLLAPSKDTFTEIRILHQDH